MYINFLKKIYRFCKKLFFYFSLIFAFIFLIVLKIFYKKKKIRFGKVKRNNIGDGTLEFFLYLNEYKKNDYKDFFFFDGKNICNHYLNSLIKKRLKFFFLSKQCNYLSSKFKFFNNFYLAMPRWWNRSKSNFETNELFTPKEFFFTDTQNQKGIDFLNGFSFKGQKIICFMVRDNSYKSFYGDKNKDWSYHNYRNANIDDYLLAVNYLLKKNYFVIRIGKSSEKKLNINNPNYLDYSILKNRDDFLDYWIISKCLFCITTGSGMDEACSVYRVPILDTNFLPLGAVRAGQKHCISIFKKILIKKTQKFLNFSDMVEMQLSGKDILKKFSYYQNSEFKERYEIIDNSPEEILDSVIELEARLNNQYIETKENLNNQDTFWKIYKKSGIYEDFVKKVNTNSKIGKLFIDKNSWVLN